MSPVRQIPTERKSRRFSLLGGKSGSPPGVLLAEIGIPLLLLLVVESGIRVYLFTAAHPPVPRLFPVPITTGKYLAYEQLRASPEPLDVLLMGLSQMMRVNAGRLERQFEKGSRNAHAFNFAAPYHWVEFNRRLLGDILVKIKHPKVAVLGITPLDVHFERDERRTNRLLQNFPIFTAYDGSLTSRVRLSFLRHSTLILYRDQIQRVFAGRPVNTVQAWAEHARRTDENGDIDSLLHSPSLPVSTLKRWEVDYARSFAKRDLSLSAETLFNHIAALAALCAEQGVRLVVLNNAVHPIFMKILPRGETNYREFVAGLEQVSRQNGVDFFDLGQGKLGQPDLFQDAVHHNEAGSIWVTDEIARILRDHQILSVRSPAPPVRSAGQQLRLERGSPRSRIGTKKI